ncbi:MAG: hypothetical protein RSB38_07515, partial [Oscillospiraceae bacterium]
MSIFKTLNFKITILLTAIILIIISLSYCTNYYIIKQNEEAITVSMENTINIYKEQIETTVNQVSYYISSILGNNSDIEKMSFIEKNSYDYNICRTNLYTMLMRDANYYSNIDTIYVHFENTNEYVIFTKGDYYKCMDYIKAQNSSVFGKWYPARYNGDYMLISTLKFDDNIDIGVMLNLNDIIKPFKNKNSKNSNIIFSDFTNTVLATSLQSQEIATAAVSAKSSSTFKHKNEEYVSISKRSETMGLDITFVASKKTMYENISFIKTFTYTSLLLIMACLLIYLLALNKILMEPLRKITNALNKLSAGNQNIIIKEKFIYEFDIIKNAINNMSHKIFLLQESTKKQNESLRISEVKRLRLQMNP